MTHSIVGYFETQAQANAAVEQIVRAGISRSHVHFLGGAQTQTATTTERSDDRSFWESLKDLFLPDEDRTLYAEGLRRGGAVVSVDVEDAMSERVTEIFEENGSVDVDERATGWRKEGWSETQALAGYSDGAKGAAPATAGSTFGMAGSATAQPATAPNDKDIKLQVVEERLNVGKRKIEGGRIKVRSYVVETPVSEQVNLHSETVHVERRPVDRALGVGEFASADAFKEKTFELRETREEAVVSKEARVKEEIGISREALDRTETIKDTVRSTKVDIEDERHIGQTDAGRRVVEEKTTTSTTPLDTRRAG